MLTIFFVFFLVLDKSLMMEVEGLFDRLRSGVSALGSALQTHLHAVSLLKLWWRCWT